MPIQEHNLLLSIKHPSRYIGDEFNCIKKDPSGVEVFIALAFPDVYEVGMSHQGLKILYRILNGFEWLAAERVFSPWTDLEHEMRGKRLDLTTLESDRPLSSFDIIGFSLQHELSYTNVLSLLDLARVPFLSRERDDSHPLIIAGGPACFNPEPVADIFDAMLIGDGEDAAPEICMAVRRAKSHGMKKSELLDDLRKIRGVYVPSFFRPGYSSEGLVDNMKPLREDYFEVRKALVPDINRYPFPEDQVVPFTSLVHDRISIEITRGCTRGCRFCQAGMIYRPVRERAPGSVIESLDRALHKTGYEELSLLSLSSGDYSCIAPLIKELMDRHSEDKIAVSLPSLRIDSMDPSWLEQIKRVRKTGFTLAPEAGNDRLRKIINKTLTDDDITTMARDLYGAGWDLIKLYFMVGLPMEQDEDVHDIVRLAKRIAALAGKRARKEVLNVSVSTFVPKAHTPFMWTPQISYEESVRRIGIIRDGLRGGRIHVKWNQPALSWLEGVFSRGDRRLTSALIEAWRLGARFDAWAEHFNVDIWKEAFERAGINPAFYLHRSRSFDEVMPWDHIKSGVKKEYFIREWNRAVESATTPDCRTKCLECGVCDHSDIDPVIHRDFSTPERVNQLESHTDADIRKYRLTFSKTGRAAYLSHLELMNLFIRSMRRAGLEMVFSKGFHPMPKLSFSTALPVGTGSLHETAVIELYGAVPLKKIKEDMNSQLPDGVMVQMVEEVLPGSRKEHIVESHYDLALKGIELDNALLVRFNQSTNFPVLKKTKNGEQTVDARPLVKSIDIVRSDGVELVVSHISGPEIKPAYLIKEIFHLSEEQVQFIKVLKTKQVVR
jgi:radical SAM family uncharacterized protein/radical SAM-linked protein